MIKKAFIGLFFIIMWLWSLPLSAGVSVQNTEHTKVELVHNGIDEVIVKFDLEPNWHIYWSNPGEIGLPTIFKSSTNVNVINQSVPEIRSFIEDMEEYVYEDKAYFHLKVENLEQAKITADFVECFDECKNESIAFDMSGQPSADIAEWLQVKEKAEATFPHKMTVSADTTSNSVKIEGFTPKNVRFIPAEKDITKPNSLHIETKNDTTSISWQLNGGQQLKQALIIADDENYLIDIEYHETALSLLYIFLLAFLGGIILNAMPCVFPILSVKIFALIGNRKKNRKPWRKALSYVLGVVLSFLILATLLIILKKQGEAVGWGFQLQEPWFVGIMALIFFVLFLFMVEWLHFPAVANNFLHKAANINAFTTGFFAVLIASPCTGPFMGVAIGYAFMHGTLEAYGVFICLALGYALPYALIEIYPACINKIMPKPGVWMRKIKIILAIPVLLTAFWLGSVWFKQVVLTDEDVSSYELDWLPYDSDTIEALNEQKANIFIDFTADWCLTCKFNEKFFINTKRFEKFVADNDVYLFKADLTEYNEDYYEALNYYERDSIPLYIYYHDGNFKILPLFFSISDMENKN